MSKITPATLLIVIFALLLGAVAAYVVRRQLIVQPVAPPPAEQVSVVPLASMDLTPGKPLTLTDVALIPLRRAEMRSRNLPPEMMGNPSQIIGRILRVPVRKGDAFTPDKFYPEGAGPSIAERLKPGFRAATVEITGADAIAGFAVPGSIVDVVFRSKALPDEPEETLTLIQGAEILALGDNAVVGKLGGIKANSPKNPVTLAVSAENANKLKVVEGEGDLSLTLRGPSDANTPTNVPTLSLNELLRRRKRPGPWVADVYRRGSRQTLRFDRNQIVSEQFGGLPLPSAAPPPIEEPPPPANPNPINQIIMPLPMFSSPMGPLPIVPPMVLPNPLMQQIMPAQP